MSIYQNLDKYFQPCINCGECCKIPGVFLPEQIEDLLKCFSLTAREVFEKYLIAELCAPNDSFTPAFVVSPVKVDAQGNRLAQKIFDDHYVGFRNLNCIFRKEGKCAIHQAKPFGCALLLCPRMTNDKSVSLNKSYYYFKWKDRQEVIFSIYPELEPIYKQLEKSVNGRNKSMDERNRLINQDIATIFNGHPIDGMPIYS